MAVAWSIDPPRRERSTAAAGQAAAVRTSASHPISLSWVAGAATSREADVCAGGSLGLCYCPGKRLVRDGVEWRRDLQSDAERLRAHYGVTCVVCLVSDHELRTLGVQPDAYRRALKAAGHDTIAFPIVEMAAPESYEATKTLLEGLLARMVNGERVAMHCRGGVGRAGTLAACLRLMRGEDTCAEGAIQAVRRMRCARAVESRRQEAFIKHFAVALAAGDE